MAILIGIIIFGIVVFIHELGHYLMAVKNGILVQEFALGMGPILLKKQKGDTLYSLRALPLGGFCKMLGEDEKIEDKRAFNSKTVWQRTQVIVAGATMNLILAFIIFCIVNMFGGFSSRTINGFTDDSAAKAAGLNIGDTITSINGNNTYIAEDIIFTLTNNNSQYVTVGYKRNDQKNTADLTLNYNEKSQSYKMGTTFYQKYGFFANVNKINNKAIDIRVQNGATIEQAQADIDKFFIGKAGFFETIAYTFWQLIFMIKATLVSLMQLITGNLGMEALSGPIGIFDMVDETYTATKSIGLGVVLIQMLAFTGSISLALGVFNLLPIPALDGGRLLFLMIEAVRGKPIDPEKEGMIHVAGFVILMAFGLFVAYNDVLKLI